MGPWLHGQFECSAALSGHLGTGRNGAAIPPWILFSLEKQLPLGSAQNTTLRKVLNPKRKESEGHLKGKTLLGSRGDGKGSVPVELRVQGCQPEKWEARAEIWVRRRRKGAAPL